MRKMTTTILMAAAMGATLVGASGPAYAQSFLKRLTERALDQAQSKIEQAAEQLTNQTDIDAPVDKAGGTSTREAAPPTVMTPRSVRSTAQGDGAATSSSSPVPGSNSN